MKKNAMLKIAAILMVAVLLTTCAISSTFAKYVTSDDVEATTATVAKWGVSVNTTFFADNANALFAKEYGAADDTPNKDTKHAATVASKNLIVAPGTKNSVNIESVASGTAEVNGKISVTCNVDLSDNWKDTNNSFYCPIIFTVGDKTVNGLDYDTETEINDAINDLLELAGVAYFDANEEINDNLNNLTFGWEWKLENGDGDAEKAANNDNDTALATGTLPTISVGFTVTIEQIGAAGTPTPATQG